MGKPMTEQEINAFLDGIVQERIEREQHGRDEKAIVRRRREMSVRKNDRLMKVVTSRFYIPNVGYIPGGFEGRTLLHSGKYIKRPKNSNRQRHLKRSASKKSRCFNSCLGKGNYYRRLFDYWWELD